MDSSLEGLDPQSHPLSLLDCLGAECVCELGRAKQPLQEVWKYLNGWLLERSGSVHTTQARSLASETEPGFRRPFRGRVLGFSWGGQGHLDLCSLVGIMGQDVGSGS